MNMTQVNFEAPKWLLLAAVMGISGTALADHGRPEHAVQNQQIVYGKVIEVTPIYRQVKVSNPVKECWSEPVTHQQHVYDGRNTAGGTLAGGILGGIIGHQFGKGRGKKLATAFGTIVGAQIGHDAASGSNAASHTSYTAYQDICEVKHQASYQQVVDSYRVNYKFKGNQYQTVLPYDPGQRIKLKMSVEPVI